jgi:hypothetical protein
MRYAISSLAALAALLCLTSGARADLPSFNPGPFRDCFKNRAYGDLSDWPKVL